MRSPIGAAATSERVTADDARRSHVPGSEGAPPALAARAEMIAAMQMSGSRVLAVFADAVERGLRQST